jgi:hypothetical protein
MGEFYTHPGDNVEEDIDENYDPTDFLQGLGQQQNPQPIIFDHVISLKRFFLMLVLFLNHNMISGRGD